MREPTVPRRIVAIGASAGGLESLAHLFAALPPTTGMSFVVIQHLAPDFRSLMDELLARHTAMPVAQARHGVTLVPDRVYVLPPAKEMIVRGGQLVLADRVGHAFQRPIDTFFRALAHDAGPRAVAVVLSGSGTDGARGIVEIKRAGGAVFAESTGSAQFASMPRAALDTGAVDDSRTPSELGRLLAGLPDAVDGRAPDSDDERGAIIAAPIRDLIEQLRARYALDFAQYKPTTVARRIQRRVALTNQDSLADYAARVRDNPDELDALYRDLLIGVTHFFRDPAAFDAVAHEVGPRLVERVLPQGEVLRVWVAGCATGEEPYSLAMLLVEAFEARGAEPRFELLATDVHDRSLAIASEGRYTPAQLAHVSEARLARFFVRDRDGYRVAPVLRDRVRFAHHDLTRDLPPVGQHLISCRNMLIYLLPNACRAALALMCFALVPGGYLFLGASEAPLELANELVAVDDRWRIYQRAPSLPATGEPLLPSPPRAEPRPRGRVRRGDAPSAHTIDAYDQLLDLFMPPGFLIADDYTLLDSFAGAERLLRAPARRPSDNVLELLEEHVRIVVGGALRRALENGEQVAYVGTPIELDGRARCTVVARPLPTAGGRAALVTFQDLVADGEAVEPGDAAVVEPRPEPRREPSEAPGDSLAARYAALQAAHDQLIAAHEELQTSYDELLAINEHMRDES